MPSLLRGSSKPSLLNFFHAKISYSLALLLVFSLAIRLLWLGEPALLGDEAYYYDWSQRVPFELSFYDHPPMVAYVIKLSVAIFGASSFGVRALNALLSTASIYLVYAFARYAFRDEKAALLSAFVTAISTPHLICSRLALMENLVLVELLLMSLCFFKYYKEGAEKYLVLSGLLFGASVLTKYNLLVAPLGLASFLALKKKLPPKRTLAKAALAALVLSAVVVAWNAFHGWSSAAFQYEHWASAYASGASTLKLAELAEVPLAVFSPFLLALIAAGTFYALFKARSEAVEYLLFVILPFALFFAPTLAEHPHWAYPAFFALALISGWGLAEASRKRRILAVAFVALLALSSASTIATLHQLSTLSSCGFSPKVVGEFSYALRVSQAMVRDLEAVLDEWRPDAILTCYRVPYSLVRYYFDDYRERVFTYHYDYQAGVLWRSDLAYMPKNCSKLAVLVFLDYFVDINETVLEREVAMLRYRLNSELGLEIAYYGVLSSNTNFFDEKGRPYAILAASLIKLGER